MTAFRTAPASSAVQKLVALAQEPACGRRRILLHEITDPLFAAPPGQKEDRLEALLPLLAEELAAAEYTRRQRLRRRLGHDLLFRLLRDGERARAIICFSELTEIGYEAAHGVFADPSNELMAMICKVQGWPRSRFVTLALLRDGQHEPTLDAASHYAAIYDRIPMEAAQRAVRFWRLRRRAADAPDESGAGPDQPAAAPAPY